MVQLPIKVSFLRGPCVRAAFSTVLGKGRERTLLHSLEPEEILSARPVLLLAERRWRWTAPFPVTSDGRH